MESVTTVNANPSTGNPAVGTGTAGLSTQVGNQPATASGLAMASNPGTGIAPGALVEPDIDDELFKFSSDDTPLMNLMLKAKKVPMNSPEVDHYMIDEPQAIVKTTAATSAGKLTFSAADSQNIHAYDTLCVKGSNNGSGRPIQLFVTEVNETSGEVSVLSDNYSISSGNEYGTISANDNNIPSGSEIIILGNALYETQKEVDPDLVLPRPTRVYLQKRGMNNIVSDYFDSQRKRIPFTHATVAEAAIKNFKVKGNRTLWIGQKSKIRVKSKKTGSPEYVYKTEGVRWQFTREIEHRGRFNYENFTAMGKMFYTGEDIPSSCMGLCGNNFLERINNIDWSNHKEVIIEQKTTNLGWSVMNIHTAFGDIMFKHEPTLDRIGYSNSCALIDPSRLVHYQRTAEHSFEEKVEGEEATRSGILVWDALCLKGSCHIWIDGEGRNESAPNATEFIFWRGNAMPTASTAVDGSVYLLENEITENGVTYPQFSAWKATVTPQAGSTPASVAFTQYEDMVFAG